MRISFNLLVIGYYLIICSSCYSQYSAINSDQRWSQRVSENQNLEKIVDDANELNNLDLTKLFSNLSEEDQFFSSYIGAIGKDFQRIDLQFSSAKKIKSQDYQITANLKLGEEIHALIGNLIFKEGFIIQSNFPVYIFTFDYNFREKKLDKEIEMTGTSSITFYLESNEPSNFWFADGDLQEYQRTFVGQFRDKNNPTSQQCVFSLSATGLEYHLPFCDNLFQPNEEGIRFSIKNEYKNNGWEDYDEDDNRKYNW